MSISFFGATGDFYNRLGKIGLLLKQIRTYQIAQFTNCVDVNSGVVAQLNAESDIQATMGSAYIGLLNGAGSSVGGIAQTMGQAVVNRMVYRDNPRFNQTLTQTNLVASMAEIIRQMNVQGVTVLRMTVSATPGVGPSGGSFVGNGASPATGTGVVVASVKRPQDGLYQENVFAETITVLITTDSYSGTAQAGNESVSASGVGQQTNLFAFDWPLGSNGLVNFQVIDGNTDNGNGNLLTNSGFENWTGTNNFLNNWQLIVGTVNTNIAKETSAIYDGSAAIKLIGDGSMLVRWRQPFGDAVNGTAATLDTLTQYAHNVYARRDGTQAGSGLLQVALTDASGTIIRDAAGNQNVMTIDLTGLTVNYTPYNFVINTPAILPSALYLDYQLLNPLSPGRNVYFDKAGYGLMNEVYASGPYLCVFAGNVPFLAGDYAQVVVANSRGSGGALDTFQTLWYRLLAPNVASLELQLPSSTNPNVSDTLIG